MVDLTRTIRFSINPDGETRQTSNGFAGSPSMRGLGRHYELIAICSGSPDPITGYLLDIKSVDRAVRGVAIPIIADACRDRPTTDPADLMPALFASTNESLGGRLTRLTFKLTPTYGVTMQAASPTTVLIRQRFDFAAAHRLHVPSLSPEQNRAVFGKCNNPAGHGHNYGLEPCVEVTLGATPRFSLQELEDLTEHVLIRRFDHKHLNQDTPEFSSEAGAIPSVEEIARVFYDLLAPEVEHASPGARLKSITVWETDRTSATYPA
jgi:6-pyruvoyltetrahydropterin/6-carboxytetrahydropterin synthase